MSSSRPSCEQAAQALYGRSPAASFFAGPRTFPKKTKCFFKRRPAPFSTDDAARWLPRWMNWSIQPPSRLTWTRIPTRVTASERRRQNSRLVRIWRRASGGLVFPNGFGGFRADGREYIVSSQDFLGSEMYRLSPLPRRGSTSSRTSSSASSFRKAAPATRGTATAKQTD